MWRFRHEVISDALRGHQKLMQGEAEGGRPVDRPRWYQEVERRNRREDKGGGGTGGRPEAPK